MLRTDRVEGRSRNVPHGVYFGYFGPGSFQSLIFHCGMYSAREQRIGRSSSGKQSADKLSAAVEATRLANRKLGLSHSPTEGSTSYSLT